MNKFFKIRRSVCLSVFDLIISRIFVTLFLRNKENIREHLRLRSPFNLFSQTILAYFSQIILLLSISPHF